MSIWDFFQQTLGPSGACALVFGCIYGAFNVCESNISAGAKVSYSRALKTGEYRRFLDILPTHVLMLFNSVFGPKHWTTKCVLRSAAVSMFAIATFWAFSTLAHLNEVLYFLFGMEWQEGMQRKIYIALGAYLIWSIILDYLNLYKTRCLLDFTRRKTIKVVTAVLFIDFILWFLFFNISVHLFERFIVLNDTVIDAFMIATKDLYYGITIQKGFWGLLSTVDYTLIRLPFANFFWAGMVTSAWLWLNFMAILFSAMILKSRAALQFAFNTLDVEEHPVRSVGFVAATMSSLLYGVTATVKALVN